jgi:hypothetical protein
VSKVRLEIDVPDEYADQLAASLDRLYVHRMLDDLPVWTRATVTIASEQEAQEKEAQWLLDKLADRNMSEGDQYGGTLPMVSDYAPVVFAGLRKELVVEFEGTLHDGTRVTTTRPLAYKDADGNIAPGGVPHRAQEDEPR